MKKRILFFGFAVLLGISLITLASAASYGFGSPREVVQSIIDAYIDIFEPILDALFGGYGWSGMYLFERLLLYVLLASLVYLGIERVPVFEDGPKAVRWIITIIVPLIGIRFIDFEWLTTIINQYMIFAVIVTSILPFVLFLFFLYNITEDHAMMRKLGWLIFAGIYAGLWTTSGNGQSSIIYFWTFLAALVFFLFDGIIYRRYVMLRHHRTDNNFKERELGNIRHEIHKIQEQIRQHEIDERVGKNLIKDLIKDEKWLTRQY